MYWRRFPQLLSLLFGFAITFAVCWWFTHSQYFPGFLEWASRNLVLLYCLLVLIKIAGIIWPPIPGGLFTLFSIPVLGWTKAYSADFLGSVIGSSIAYAIARMWGYQFLRKFLDKTTLEKITRIKVVEHREFEAIFVLRIFGGTLVEVICYGAGLLKVAYKNFLAGSIASHLLVGIPSYYLVSRAFQGGLNALSVVLALVLIPVLFKLRKRYFRMKEE